MKLLLPALMILASIVGFFMYTKPLYTVASANNDQLEKVSDALDKAKQLSDIRNRLGEKYKAISPVDLDRIKKMLPDGVENIGLIIELNNIANSKGIELLNPTISGGGPTTATTGSASDTKKFGTISMSFSVLTTYDKFMEFLEELENSLRLVDVTNLTFSAPDDRTGLSTFNVTFQTYWLK